MQGPGELNLVPKGMSPEKQKFEFKPQFAHIHVCERERGEERRREEREREREEKRREEKRREEKRREERKKERENLST